MENTLERPNYYAILPAEVRYSDITPNAKLLYAEITALANKTGSCWASNKYFGDLYKVAPRAIRDWVAQLEASGFVSTKTINKNQRSISINDKAVKIHHGVGENSPHNNTSNNKSYVDLQNSLLALVNKITHRSFRTLPDRGVKKTLDVFSLDEIERALTALANDDWHKERIKEFRINYLIAPTTIDKFLALAPDKLKTQDELMADLEKRQERARRGPE